jgi:smad nuclear-interacting protein 1
LKKTWGANTFSLSPKEANRHADRCSDNSYATATHKHQQSHTRWGSASPLSDAKTDMNNNSNEQSDVKEPEQPNFGLSGALASDDKTGNIYNGVLLKFTEPPEARTPNTRWRLYVFKKNKKIKSTSTSGPVNNTKSNNSHSNDDESDELIQVLHISKQSAYLFGRDEKVADIPVHHPSLSKQHCVLQYRALPDNKNHLHQGVVVRCKPYLMDLGSTNGTFINGVRIDDARYYELRKGDVITLGSSSREYVLLTENTTAQDL